MTQLDMIGMDFPDEPTPSGKSLVRPSFQTLQRKAGPTSFFDIEGHGYSPALFSQVTLPYSNPKNAGTWERTNGAVTLRVTPWTVTNPETGQAERRYPYGILPRLLIAYLTTEVKRPGRDKTDRVVELGASLSEFMRILDMKHTGPNAARLREHMNRFFSASIKFEGLTEVPGGQWQDNANFQFVDRWSIFIPSATASRKENAQSSWLSTVTLSEQFFKEIRKSPVPISLKALHNLGASPFRVDVYLWLTWRMFKLDRPTQVSWVDLYNQFGAQYADLRRFRREFLIALAAVKKEYPGLNVEEGPDCLLIKPSPTHIPRQSHSAVSVKSKTGRLTQFERRATPSIEGSSAEG